MNCNLHTRPTRYDKSTYFSDLKKANMKLAHKLRSLEHEYWDEDKYPEAAITNPQYYERVSMCSSQLELWRNTSDNSLKLTRKRCHDRFCPICNHVQSTKIASFLTQDYNRVDENHFYITFSFTCKNVPLDSVRETMLILTKAFSDWHNVNRKVLGYVAGLRTLEVTYNSDPEDSAYNTYHPHLHVILKFRYFDENNKREFLQKLNSIDYGYSFAKYLPDSLCGWVWNDTPTYLRSNECDVIDYISNRLQLNPMVIINQRPKYYHKTVDTHFSEYNANKSTLFEFAKYITKLNDLIDNLSDKDFVTFYQATKGIRTKQFLGEWRTWQKQLNTEDGKIWGDRSAIRQNANYVLQIRFAFCRRSDLENCYKFEPEFQQFLVDSKIIRSRT